MKISFNVIDIDLHRFAHWSKILICGDVNLYNSSTIELISLHLGKFYVWHNKFYLFWKVRQFARSSVRQFARLLAHLLVRPFVRPSVRLSVRPSVRSFRGVAGRGGPGSGPPQPASRSLFSNDPNPMSFLLKGVGGMGIGHIVTICVYSILRLVFIVVHNCDLWIYFTITLIVIAAQERSSKPLVLYFDSTKLWIRKLIIFPLDRVTFWFDEIIWIRKNWTTVAPPWAVFYLDPSPMGYIPLVLANAPWLSRKNNLPENAKLYYSNKCFLNSLKCTKLLLGLRPRPRSGSLQRSRYPWCIYVVGNEKIGFEICELTGRVGGLPQWAVSRSDLTGNNLANFVCNYQKKIFLNNWNVEK